MATGTLKMWNADRGFGFITDDSGGPDIFMHITALRGIDPDNLRLGERLTFDVERDRRPVKARRAGDEGEDQALIARVYSGEIDRLFLAVPPFSVESLGVSETRVFLWCNTRRILKMRVGFRADALSLLMIHVTNYRVANSRTDGRWK